MMDFSFNSSLLSNGFSDVCSSLDTNEALSPGSNISAIESPEPARRDLIHARCRVVWLNAAHVVYGCCACEESFLAPHILEHHLRSAHPWLRSAHVCPECGQRFLHSGHVLRHRRERHDLAAGARQHACQLCDKRFKRAEHLRVHERTMHARTRDYACALCERTFGRRHHVLRHQRQVHRVVELRCVHCDKAFARASGLAKHQAVCRAGKKGPEVVHPTVQLDEGMSYEEGEELRCVHCDKAFARASGLAKHQAVCRAGKKGPEVVHPTVQLDEGICYEEGEELLSEQCGKAFGRVASLTRHQATCRETNASEVVQPAEGQVMAELEVDQAGVVLNCEEDDWIKLLMLQ